MNEEKIKNILRHGKPTTGQKELIKHLEGHTLTLRQAFYAKCYDCGGFYAAGKVDCGLPECPLHPFMTYNENRTKRIGKRTKTKSCKETIQTELWP